MCDWGRELAASKDLFPDRGQDIVIPPWLEAGEQASVDSLFALRDFMLQEALSVVKSA
jgi:hypothetical protein